MKTFQQQVERGGKVSAFPNKDLEHTVRMPCEPCNNGWMSELENEVKPFVTDMAFRGQKTLLDETRQRSLVRWAVKTAMVNEFTGAAAEQKYLTEVERLSFRDNYAIPANLWIWLARYDGVLPLHSLQIRAPKTADKRPTLYSLTFGSNFFVMQVFACREDRFAASPRRRKAPGSSSFIRRRALGFRGPLRRRSMMPNFRCSTIGSPELSVGLSSELTPESGERREDVRRLYWGGGRSVGPPGSCP